LLTSLLRRLRCKSVGQLRCSLQPGREGATELHS
jgi:hypothetical protein